jgi:predicted nucleotidyltransferase
MSLVAEYCDARHDEHVARLRRVISLRAMIAAGMSQREVAEQLGISQSAVSQQLKFLSLDDVHPEILLKAAAPILKALAKDHGYTQLAVFGSTAQHRARRDSDIDLLVEAPKGTSSFGFIRFKQLIERVLDRQVDLVAYAGLKPGVDDDIHREAVLL